MILEWIWFRNEVSKFLVKLVSISLEKDLGNLLGRGVGRMLGKMIKYLEKFFRNKSI